MRRRAFLQSGMASLAMAQPQRRLNILLFCTDQQRFDTIRALGNPHIRTPNIDRLVKAGTAFENAYCQTPICTPSRASFLTGCYASWLHVNRNGNSHFPEQHTPKLLSRLLQGEGYDCGLVGKFHLSSAAKRVEPRINDGYRLFEWSHAPRADWPADQNGYLGWLRNKGIDFNSTYGRRQFPGRSAEFNAGMPADYHEVTWCADTAAQWIRGKLHQPWFITVNTYAPHPPFHPPAEALEKIDPASLPPPLWDPKDAATQERLARVDFQSTSRDPKSYQSANMKAAYYAQIEFIDDRLGRVLRALDETGQTQNTLIVFSSDHGEMMGDHGLNHKGCRFYEGLSHIPLILSWPGQFPQGVRSKALVELTDLVPTILDTLRKPLPAYLHGRSLLPILTGAKTHHRDFVRSEYHDVLDLPNASHANMLRNERYKLVCYHGISWGELYDLEKDPREFTNLWDDPRHLPLRAELMRQLFDAVMQTTDPGQPRIAGS